MNITDKYRLRVQNCVGTIIDVHGMIQDQYEVEESLNQFQDLEEAIKELDMNLISELDVLMLEQATNALLAEFKILFEAGKLGTGWRGYPLN
jgi:hypothetical protein